MTLADQVTVLIPTRQRFDDLKKCIYELDRHTQYRPFNVLVIVDHDEDVFRALQREEMPDYVSLHEMPEGKRDWVDGINYGVGIAKQNASEFVVLYADDVWALDGWLTAAIDHLKKTFPPRGIGVLGLHDGIRSGELACHSVVHLSVIDRIGVGDNLLCSEYIHYYTDNELTFLAKRANLYTHTPDAWVHHDHPSAGGKNDDLYGETVNRAWNSDCETHKRRMEAFATMK